MRVLVACEYSGRVRDAFRRRGHDAWSCDLLECEGDASWHLQQPVEDVLHAGWDLMIAHPPCTHLAVSGSRHFYRKQREQAAALDFVRLLMAAPIARWCIENPVSVISSAIAPPPANHSAVAVWAWRDQGDMPMAEQFATVAADVCCGWPRSAGASDGAKPRSVEGAQQNI
jgi:site-specific DNA-cytosine methylase